MAVRPWIYKGYTIQSYPKGLHYKYVVQVNPSTLIAGTTLAEVFIELDRISASILAKGAHHA